MQKTETNFISTSNLLDKIQRKSLYASKSSVDKKESLELIYFSDNETPPSNSPTFQISPIKQKSKFYNNMQQPTELNLDNLAEFNKPSRSRSTYDKNRPAFLQKKKIQPIICNMEQKIEEIQTSPLSPLYKINEKSMSPGTINTALSLDNSSQKEKLSFFVY